MLAGHCFQSTGKSQEPLLTLEQLDEASCLSSGKACVFYRIQARCGFVPLGIFTFLARLMWPQGAVTAVA